MYQFNMSVNSDNSHWFYNIEQVLSLKIKNFNGIMAAKEYVGRLNISIACENEHKTSITGVIKECIIEMFLTTVKHDYISKVLHLPNLKGDSYKILLHTLVAFDRDAEREIILSNLKFSDNIALDGFFNFKLAELRKRWNDIADLAVSNAIYLTNDDTLNELLKFLMSAVSPKIMKLEVIKQNNEYNVKGKYMESNFEYKIFSQEQLLVYLINIAPLELTLKGSFDDDKLYKRLVSIFDAKPPEIFSERI